MSAGYFVLESIVGIINRRLIVEKGKKIDGQLLIGRLSKYWNPSVTFLVPISESNLQFAYVS